MIEIRSAHAPDARLLDELTECWQSVLARPEVGFPRLLENAEMWSAIKARVAQLRPAKRCLILGIGGSSLGAQVIHQCFRFRSPCEVFFLESPDPYAWKNLGDFKAEEWRDRNIIIVSKSGNTLETLSWVEWLRFVEPGWLNSSQATVIASPGEGPLQTWAKQEKIPTLWIPANVGGRFSVLSAVGMLPAAIMGLNLDDFREGAQSALSHPKLAAKLSAHVVNSWARGEWITQMWTYSESLRVFGEWWQQLWGESLAKKYSMAGGEAKRASTPMACLGPRDQHSLVQQLIEGHRDKFVFVTRVAKVEASADGFTPGLFPAMPFAGRQVSLGLILGAEAEAFERSLSESKVSFATIKLDSVNEKSLGALFMLWQMSIAQIGEYIGVNAFDQPGVEMGKKFAAQILKS